MSIEVSVCSSPFDAKGDGKTDDRQAIQQALDDAFKNGGGRVILTAGKTFLTAGLVIKSGVELFFEDGRHCSRAATLRTM